MKKRKILIVLVVLILLLSIFPVSFLNGKRSLVVAKSSDITIGIIGEPDSLGFLDSTMVGADVRGAIFASLIGFTFDGKPYPDLLEKVPSVDDGTIQIDTSHNMMTVIYTLKKGLNWSDGKPITSHDFYFTWLMMNNANITQFPSRDPYDKITSVETPDRFTFITHWNEINILEVFYVSIYPSHILEPIYNNNPKDIETCSYNTMPIHAGPYKIVEWNKGNYISLVRNPYYYGNKPQIKDIVFEIFNDTTAMRAAVLAGTIDLLDPGSLQITGINYLKANGAESNYNILFVESIFWEHLTFNMDDPIVGDSNNSVLRKALMYAINKQEIIDTVYGVSRSVANVNMEEKGSIYYNPNADIYSYNPTYARQILQNAGYYWDADGHLRKPTGELVQITLKTSTRVDRGPEAEMICNYWSNIGVVANYVQLDYDVFFGYCLPHRNFQVAMFAWGGTVTGPDFLLYNSTQIPTPSNMYSVQNYAGFVSPELDALENQMNKISFINNFSLAYQIESILTDKIPELPLNQFGDSLIVKKTLQGINYPISNADTVQIPTVLTIPITWNIQDWYVGTPQTLSITTASAVPNGTVNIPYLKFLDVTGGVIYKKFSIISGNLPSGLILNQSGTIAGTPTQSGTFNFTAKVEDYAGNYTTKAFSIIIH